MTKKSTKRKPLFGNKRSHALNTTKKKQSLNLQKTVNEKGETVIVSAREAKTMKKNNISDVKIEEIE